MAKAIKWSLKKERKSAVGRYIKSLIEGSRQVSFKENEPIQNLIKATMAQTHGTFQNITQSMGFAMKDPAGKMRYQSLRNFYTQTLDNECHDGH